MDNGLSTGLVGLWITFFTVDMPLWLARLPHGTYVVPMTYTAAHHTAAIANAATSQRDSARDGGLADYLLQAQQGICFDCDAAPATEFAHFTRAKGRTTRDLHVLGAMACRRCNLKHDRICDALGTDGTLPYAYLAANGRADRVVTVYPTRAALVERHTASMAAYEANLADEVAAELANLA